MSDNVRDRVNQFVKQHSLKKINYDSLCTAAEELGYTVIEFNAFSNPPDVETVIRNLRLEKAIAYSRGFTYSDRNYRLIFINGDLADSEKTLLLSHELGHIVSGHLNTFSVIGNDVNEEHMANEFSHYLLNRSKFSNITTWAQAHKKSLTVSLAATGTAAITAITGVTVNQPSVSYGEYYITPSGRKYHEAQCIHIKDKTTARQMTEAEFNSGFYEKCKICLPE